MRPHDSALFRVKIENLFVVSHLGKWENKITYLNIKKNQLFYSILFPKWNFCPFRLHQPHTCITDTCEPAGGSSILPEFEEFKIWMNEWVIHQYIELHV